MVSNSTEKITPIASQRAEDLLTPSGEQRPAFWSNPDGSPLTAFDVDLFSAPVKDKLVSYGWDQYQAKALLSHIGRDAFHGSATRDFSKSYKQDAQTGEVIPRYYRVGSAALAKCQYAKLTHPSRSAVLVIDIDTPSHTQGGTIEALHPDVAQHLTTLHLNERGPAWIGINPLNGKAQALWLIDPVYAAAGRSSSNTRLLKIATDELNILLGGDCAFSHHFSRWPLHQSDDPTAYKWHCQHNQIVRLADLVKEARTMTARKAPEPAQKPEQYPSGRERIRVAQDAAKAAQALRQLNTELASVEELAPAAAGVVDGVRVLWINEHRTARDETAFRHALATAHRMRAAGQPLKDAKIIDAYERAYNLAQSLGADHREPELPPMRDRLTMARRVRSYVTRGVTDPAPGGASAGLRLDTAGRKALATLGRRGGQQAAKRWNDPNAEEYQQAARAPLTKANQQRSYSTDENKGRLLALVSSYRKQGIDVPPTKELAHELDLSVRRVQELRKELGIASNRGRPPRAK